MATYRHQQDSYSTIEATGLIQERKSSSLKAKAVILGFLLVALGAFVGQKASQAWAVPVPQESVNIKSTVAGKTVPLYTAYSSDAGVADSCTGPEWMLCHGKTLKFLSDSSPSQGSRIGYIFADPIDGKTVPLYTAYSSRMTDSCTGLANTPCHDLNSPPKTLATMEGGVLIGHILKDPIDGKTAPLYNAYSNGDSCAGTENTNCYSFRVSPETRKLAATGLIGYIYNQEDVADCGITGCGSHATCSNDGVTNSRDCTCATGFTGTATGIADGVTHAACTACTGTTYSTGGAACASWTDATQADCGDGSAWTAGTTSTDSSCIACTGTTYSTGGAACASWTDATQADCGDGSAWTAGTTSTDSSCIGCPDGSYLVSGAGDSIWNGCYKWFSTNQDRDHFQKDETHELYSYNGVWRLADYGVEVYYLGTGESLLPPSEWAAEGNGIGPAPTVTLAACAQFTSTQNAAISGHNREHLTDASVATCKSACCDRDWCNSFDYYKASSACDLSDAPPSTALKTNYNGHPYDHYAKDDASETA